MTTADQDSEHLRLLSIFHYVAGGLMAAFSCIPIFHVLFGTYFLLTPNGPGGNDARFVGLIFIFIGGAIILLGWALAALTAFAGRCLGQRKHYTFCLIVAGLSCLWMPFGTVLGVFTLIVLLRPSVKPLFA